MAFKPDLASKLIEFLQPLLADDDFQGLLSLIEDNFTVDDMDATKDVVAMDRALERARRAPKHQVAFDSGSGLGRVLAGGRRVDTAKAETELRAMTSGEAA